MRLATLIEDRRIWLHLGWRDLRIQYGRSRFAPLWSIANLSVSVLGLVLAQGILVGSIDFNLTASKLAVSLWIWYFFSAFLNECSTLYESERRVLLNSHIDENVLLLKLLWKQLVNSLIPVPVIIIILFFSRVLHMTGVLSLTATLILFSLCLLFPGLLLARLSVQSPNLKGVVTPAIQMMFFFSPVIWSPNPEIRISQLAVEVNPLAWVLVATKEAVGDDLGGQNYMPRVVFLSCLLIALYALAANQFSSIKYRL